MIDAKHLINLEKIDSKGMMWIYAFEVALNLLYLFMIWIQPDYSLNDDTFFTLFYSFMSGVTCFISAALFWHNVARKGRARHPFLLLSYSVLQTVVIIADIFYAFIYGSFWYDGYLFMTIELILLASYMRRYFILKYFTNIEIDF